MTRAGGPPGRARPGRRDPAAAARGERPRSAPRQERARTAGAERPRREAPGGAGAAGTARRRGREGRRAGQGVPPRRRSYRDLENPFSPQRAFSDDEVAALHEQSLRILSELGIKVLLPEARKIFREAGAIVDEEAGLVRIGPDIVAAALASAPGAFTLRAGAAEFDTRVAPGAMILMPGAGCPYASDRLRGRRPGSMRDYEELITLVAASDAMHMQAPVVEPQDVPVELRHYAMTRFQLVASNKVPFVYSRGRPQVEDVFEMLRIWRGLDEDGFRAEPRTWTVINTNSPRLVDRPMAQGIIDHARWGQACVITPFCMMGAMAPVSVAGALCLQHAEALACIALGQAVRPGSPIMYGNFASNVDMKSGAPVFGTPEHFKATLGAGQLARHIGLTWRSSAGCAANVADAQAAHETEISTWAAVMAGATMILHTAGWLEGGLVHSYEKFVTDLELAQILAELCRKTAADDAEMAFEAIREVAPGGHFFGAAHTMERFHTAFYEPRNWISANFGQWSEAGGKDARERATDTWQAMLEAYRPPQADAARLDALDEFVARRTAEGGAPPGE